MWPLHTDIANLLVPGMDFKNIKEVFKKKLKIALPTFANWNHCILSAPGRLVNCLQPHSFIEPQKPKTTDARTMGTGVCLNFISLYLTDFSTFSILSYQAFDFGNCSRSQVAGAVWVGKQELKSSKCDEVFLSSIPWSLHNEMNWASAVMLLQRLYSLW